MSERHSKKPMSKAGAIVLVGAVVVFVVVRFLGAQGVELGVVGEALSWICVALVVLTFLDPIFWLFRVVRGGGPWDA